MAEALVAGYVNTDILCEMPGLVAWDARVTARRISWAPGGMAANVACTLARLGTSARLFGKVESGGPGAWLIAALDEFGVDTSGVARIPGGGTTSVVFVGDDGRRAIVSQPLDFDWSAFDAALAGWRGEPTVLYVDGYRALEALERAGNARARGMVTAADLDGCDASNWPALGRLAAAFDVLFVNRGFVERAGRTPEALAARLVADGATVVCVTLGSAGALLAAPGTQVQLDAFEVQARDTTGAGDVFAGAFLHRYLQGASALEAARYASAAAAIATTASGATGHLPTNDETLGLMARGEGAATAERGSRLPRQRT